MDREAEFIKRLEGAKGVILKRGAKDFFGFPYFMIRALGNQPYALAYVKVAQTEQFQICLPQFKWELGTTFITHFETDSGRKLKLLCFVTTPTKDYHLEVPRYERGAGDYIVEYYAFKTVSYDKDDNSFQRGASMGRRARENEQTSSVREVSSGDDSGMGRTPGGRPEL